MTQAQRKKALAEAQERLRLAENGLRVAENAVSQARLAEYEARRELARNEPLTKTMQEVLMVLYTHDGWITKSTFSKTQYYTSCSSFSVGDRLRESVFDGLRERELLGMERKGDEYYRKEYPLSDWGKQVAEALAKAEGS